MIIKNAIIYDGTGNLPFNADLLIDKDKIGKINYHLNIADNKSFDAQFLCLAPGFINMHSHSDLEVFRNKDMEHVIRQGITTEIIGQDGLSVAPVINKVFQELANNMACLAGIIDKSYWWRSFGEYLDEVRDANPAVRIESLIGHGTIRMCVMGNDNRKPNSSELKKMKELTAKCLKEGARGMSFGLAYPPSSYAQTKELIELAKVVAEFDGIVMAHMRNEGDHLLDSIEEMGEVARRSKVRLHISHLTANGPKNWGKIKEALKKLTELRKEGLDIGFDHYPYTAGCTGLKRVVPDWAYAGGEKGFQFKINRKDKYHKILSEVKYHIEEGRGGAEKIMISSVPSSENYWMVGKTLSYIAEKMNLLPEEAALKILQMEGPSVVAIYFCLDENDVIEAMTSPWQAICTDGIIGSHPHPRTYGSFPRVLGKYVRELNIMRLEEAIRKMTMEPARRLRLWDRGLIREGMSADLVLFDPNRIKDQNSYIKPKIFPIGIRAVWVKGKLIYCDL